MLGWSEGVAEGISSGLRWLGGALSDRYRHRKPFVSAGYALSALSKPVMGLVALAVGWPLAPSLHSSLCPSLPLGLSARAPTRTQRRLPDPI